MERTICLYPDALRPIRAVDKRLVSYNVEMTGVTGGIFWKEYTPGQIAGTEAFPPLTELSDFTRMEGLPQYDPPMFIAALAETAERASFILLSTTPCPNLLL